MATHRILIASPFAEDRSALRRILEAAGFEVVADVEDGPAAVEEARKLRPAAVLLHHSNSSTSTRFAELDAIETITQHLTPDTQHQPDLTPTPLLEKRRGAKAMLRFDLPPYQGGTKGGLDEGQEANPHSLTVSPMDGLAIARALSTEKLAAPLLIIDSDSALDVELFEDAAVLGCIVKPFVEAQVISAVLLALSQWREQVRLQGELDAAVEKLEVRKLVDRAKSLLIAAHGLNETEAFRRLQTQSMNTRRSLKEVAQSVIASYLERR